MCEGVVTKSFPKGPWVSVAPHGAWVPKLLELAPVTVYVSTCRNLNRLGGEAVGLLEAPA